MNLTYLTTEGLSERIHYDQRTIRERLKDSVLIEGVHYMAGVSTNADEVAAGSTKTELARVEHE